MEDTDKDSILKYKRGSRHREFEDLQIDTTTRGGERNEGEEHQQSLGNASAYCQCL